jgi:uncharacterized membrane protein YhaH (DUF805 family)
MTIGQAVCICMSKYVTFAGRASRAEFWYWELFIVVVGGGLLGLGLLTSFGFPLFLFDLVTISPTLAVIIRRLHDTNHSGWSILVTFVPAVGIVLMIIWLCRRGTYGSNQFGPSPAEQAP